MMNHESDYQQWLRRMRRERDEWRAKYEEAKTKFEATQEIVDALERLLDEAESEAQIEGGAVRSESPYAHLTMPDAIKEFLKASGTPRTTREIAEGVLAGGLETKSRNIYTSVSSTLSRISRVAGSRVRKVRRGLWELQDPENAASAGSELEPGERIRRDARLADVLGQVPSRSG
jgi:hypothetical protein